MKKKVVFLLCTVMAIYSCFVGCGNKTVSEPKTNDAQKEVSANKEEATEEKEEAKEESNKDFDGSSFSDIGSGTFFISTPSGTSQDGNVPVFLKDAGTLMTEVGYSAREMDGTHLTYFYIDGMENDKDQISDTDGSLIINGDMLSEGTHTVEVVQYDTDEPTGNVITYKSATYEVK